MSSENVEKYMDKQTGMFNQYALGIVSREFVETKRGLSFRTLIPKLNCF